MSETGSNFLRAIIEEDLAAGRVDAVVTRFPPEPNGYLHIGHAKAICIDFGLAEAYNGTYHLRFDDTNPEKEEQEYIDAIQRDVRWLGFDWGDRLFYASDFFDEMYELAEGLVLDGKAYVDSDGEDEIRQARGTVTEAGTESPYRGRSVEENIDLFRRMRAGEFPDGAHVLRAKIDMSSPNMKMRDPLLYRVRHLTHPLTGDEWCIYPFYDYAHPLEDALEGVTHSFCSLEFENNRELYDWVLDHTRTEWKPRPRQYEFARLFLAYTLMSKRKLLALVNTGKVMGWDDPRMTTLAGMRRRGVTPEAIRAFADRIGVAKANSMVDLAALDACIRDDLETRSPRRMAVLRPLKLVIDNYPEDQSEVFDIGSWPADMGRPESRKVPFSRELYIERDDFMEDPPKGFHRLAPGQEIRLRGAYLVTCTGFETGRKREVVAVHCSYDPDSKGGTAPDGRKVRGTLHWVSARHAVDAQVRLVDRLFSVEQPGEGVDDIAEHLNPDSMEVVTAKLEPSLASVEGGERFQFERQGFFYADPVDSAPGAPVFNRTVALKDSWTKPAQPAPTRAAPKRAPTEPSKPERPPRNAVEEARFELYTRDRKLSEDDADQIARDNGLSQLFSEALSAHENAQGIANWIVNDLLGMTGDRDVRELPFGGVEVGQLVALIDDGTISTRIAKDVLAVLLEQGGDPSGIVQAHGWVQVSDRDALLSIVARLVEAHPDKVAEYRGGRTGLMGFFVGQVMRETGGKANPQLVQELLAEQLGAG